MEKSIFLLLCINYAYGLNGTTCNVMPQLMEVLKMNKNERLFKLAQSIIDLHVKPVVERCNEMPRKPIKYNAALDENDYMEYIASKKGKLKHIKKGDK